MFGWEFDPQIFPYPGGHEPHLTQCGIGPHKCTCQMASKPVERCKQGALYATDDRQTDRPRYREMSRNRRKRLHRKSDSAYLAFATLPLPIPFGAFLKLTASSRPSAPPSDSPKCLRFGHWLTLCSLNIHLLEADGIIINLFG